MINLAAPASREDRRWWLAARRNQFFLKPLGVEGYLVVVSQVLKFANGDRMSADEARKK